MSVRKSEDIIRDSESSTVEIILGPFRGEKAKVISIDTSKNEVTLELLDSGYPIQIKTFIDYVRSMD
jgi:transcriptional antiterminator NusG